jgi:hypothetical protein
VQVLITVGLLAVLAGLWFAIVRRLARMREEVKLAWKRLEADQSNDAIKHVYNKHVAAYNQALENFPANVIGPLSGFKPARLFVPPEA